MFVIVKMLPFRVSPYLVCLALIQLTVTAQDYGYSTTSSEERPDTTKSPGAPPTLPVMNENYGSSSPDVTDCPVRKIAFELVTGYVYSAPADMLDSQPGTLMLTDCIDMCRRNNSCLSVNYETGLCVLFSSNSDMYPGSLTKSQFPVFTLYVQKFCLKKRTDCRDSWNFERVMGFELVGHTKKTEVVENRNECSELCLTEKEFVCRSSNYNNLTGECGLSSMNRHTMAGTDSFHPAANQEYLESNCASDPVRMCEFQKMESKILKTVDSVYQNVESLEMCKERCLLANYNCHSFDFGDTGDKVCRLSHHAVATLIDIEEPYLHIPEASTYELSSCYNVTIDCGSGEMVAKIKTSKIFDGKIYSKGSPHTCFNDVQNSLEFDLVMPYNDVDCNIKRDPSSSRYSNDVIIQHHDMIVTSNDLGLSVHCQYDLSNKSVSNKVDLNVTGTVAPVFEEEKIVDSPNVMMFVTDANGDDVQSAEVGDMLELRFMIVDPTSPYEIFVRDLVALDGTGEKRIALLDNRGCPTELAIMRSLVKIDQTGKLLGSSFDAFKFPTSDKVQFRALVTPCIPYCEPVTCDVLDFGGQKRVTESYGRKKRDLASYLHEYGMAQDVTLVNENHLDIYVHPVKKQINSQQTRVKRETIPEELILEQSIKISDKFGFRSKPQIKKQSSTTSGDQSQFLSEEEMVITEDVSGLCINTMGLVLACSLFLVAQVILIIVWTAIWQRRRHSKLDEPLSHTTTTESLRQLYDSGYARRI